MGYIYADLTDFICYMDENDDGKKPTLQFFLIIK